MCYRGAKNLCPDLRCRPRVLKKSQSPLAVRFCRGKSPQGALLLAEGLSRCPMSSMLGRSSLPPVDQVQKRERRGGGPSRPMFPASLRAT